MTRWKWIALFFVLLLPAQAGEFATWVRKTQRKGIKVSAGMWDLHSGKLVEGHQTNLALIPASTTKVVSTYALLKLMKPNAVAETEIWGTQAGDTILGDLVFKGAGDPYITSERLWLMAQSLKNLGVTKIQGKVRLDQSAFDGQRYGNGWENTTVDTTPPILPFSVNFNRDDKGLISHDPEPLAVNTISRILRESGVQILEQPSLVEPILTKLLVLQSQPLRSHVLDINKYSNNFMIEMLVKRLGEGNWPTGIRRIQAFYKDTLNLDEERIALTDGSGLSKENRLSARTLSTVLRSAWYDFEVGPEFVASLKVIGGEPWEMSINDPTLTRRIRCKTGHLSGVTSVCGYLQDPRGRLRVFAIVLNGPCRLEDAWSMVSAWAN